MHCCRFERRQTGTQYADGLQHGESCIQPREPQRVYTCTLRSMFTMYYLLVCIMYVDTHIYISNPDVNAVPPGKIHRANEVRQGVP